MQSAKKKGSKRNRNQKGTKTSKTVSSAAPKLIRFTGAFLKAYSYKGIKRSLF